MSKDAQVIVVGAGPAGLTLATELALAGCDVLVIERREEGVQSRAGTVLPRVLELLDYRGLAQKFIARARQIRDNPLIPFHIWAGLQPIHWSNLRSAFGYRLVLQQNVTEELLMERAQGLGARIIRGRTVVGLDQNASQVTVNAETPDGVRESYTADYVVGADGGRSAVRKLAEIPFPGHDGTFTGIIADVPVNMHWEHGRAMVDNEKGWAASFPFSDGGEITRFNFVHADRRFADKSEPVTAAEVRQCLKDIFQLDIEFDELVWASRFTDAMRLADSLRSGRVFLVGESARIHYPASGVGMNFCIQDAFNLGWKLALVVQGRASDRILDSYQSERMPVAVDLLESVRAQCAVQFDFSSEGIAFKRMFSREILPLPEVNRAIGLQLNGLTNPYPAASGNHPLLGRPVPEATLQTRDGLVRIAELLASGRFLLLDMTGDEAFSELASDAVVVTSGVVSGARAEFSGVRAILVRPDGYVHWVSTDASSSIAEAEGAILDWLIA
ncbi:FAD-dependent oxidoreductase [Glaciihabitans sp. UYNi722]|uniref:FAD-dependent oxidoreductase n=1 Tax=Glaciihabitans sp. UYNi722 TaxID=3156344 RepID=UPI0033968CE6